jgi:hypothetical protein
MFALALAFKFPLFILTLWTTKLSAVTINRASHTHSQVQSIVSSSRCQVVGRPYHALRSNYPFRLHGNSPSPP